MQEDASLFKYEFAVVLIIKDEAIYVKEWLDYHLLVGVEHFYVYDNESRDNLKEVLRPYVAEELVTYIPIVGSCAQCSAYSDAVHRFRFDCRYMIFIDVDEFILPKGGRHLREIVDEVFAINDHIGGFSMHMLNFGSSGHIDADLNADVIERFVHRAPDDHEDHQYVKTIVNPRTVRMPGVHNVVEYFTDKVSVDEYGRLAAPKCALVSVDKIAVNHYRIKSREEYAVRIARGDAFYSKNPRSMETFERYDVNDVFDDSIVKYRDELMNAPRAPLEPSTKRNARVLNALLENLSPALEEADDDFYRDKLDRFMTCRAVTVRLHRETKLLSDQEATLLEETALNCVFKSLTSCPNQFWKRDLLLDELPKILRRPYQIVNGIRNVFKRSILPEILIELRTQRRWNDYMHFDFINRML